MRKRLWSPDEDEKLQKYVSQHGFGNWSEVAKKTGLQRCGKSCRLRWINYLRPDLKRGKFSAEEKLIIVNLQKVFGNSWSKIAAHLPGRTDSDIKNFWHSHFRKKRPQQLITSTTTLQNLLPTLSSTLHPSNPSHVALMNSIHQASSSPYASFLNASSSSSSSCSSYLHHHPLFNPSTESISTNISIPIMKTPNSTLDISRSSHDPPQSIPFPSGSSLQLINLTNNGVCTKQGNSYLHVINQKLSSNVSPPMAEEDASLYATKGKGEDDQNHEELLRNDYDLIGSLCQHTATWYKDENTIHERDSANSSDCKIGNNNNMHSPMRINDSASLEMLMYQSMSTSSDMHAPHPPPPEGLDLVVWSCVNRPSQLDQEDILPMSSSHVTLANNMHNMSS